jgi:hypothetical protein
MDALLTAMVLWLSLNFGLPATYGHPKIEMVPTTELVFLRYHTLTSEKRREISASPGVSREVVAIYDDSKKTIFLSDGWTGRTPAELSVLVHELVHHLQKNAGFKYECPAAREKLAYDAQEKWLSLYGLSLMSEFEMDSFTLMVKTTCGL